MTQPNLAAELSSLKEKNERLLKTLEDFRKKAESMMLWPFNLQHASESQYDTFLEQKTEYELAEFHARKLIREYSQ